MRKFFLVGLAIGFFIFMTIGTSSAAPISTTYTDFNTKLIGMNVGTLTEDVEFSITNNTGILWTDFHLQVALGPAGTVGSAFFWTSSNDGDVYEGPGSETLSGSPNADIMDIIGLNIADGSVFDFSVDIAAGESGWAMVGYPTVGGTGAVPEPATMLLFGIGLLGLAGVNRKKNRNNI